MKNKLTFTNKKKKGKPKHESEPTKHKRLFVRSAETMGVLDIFLLGPTVKKYSRPIKEPKEVVRKDKNGRLTLVRSYVWTLFAQ